MCKLSSSYLGVPHHNLSGACRPISILLARPRVLAFQLARLATLYLLANNYYSIYRGTT